MRTKVAIGVVLVVVLIIGIITFKQIFYHPKTATINSNTLPTSTTMHLISSAFANGQIIPQKYTCDGENVSPPLVISDVLPNAKSLVLIADDPDAPLGDWAHWLVWNIKPETKEITENSVPVGAIQGTNDFGKTSYDGPCPPSGTHRYQFKLYALDKIFDLSPNSKRADLEKALQSHILDQTVLGGLYKH